MKNFIRNNLLFSLCGLNCGLCPMHLGRYCPGCGGGEGNQSCKIAKCSLQHSGVEYCFQCPDFPCEKYEGIDEFDSFITHQNRLSDFKKAQKIGIDAYTAEQAEKAKILSRLLAEFDDGRHKNFFCVAVNLLEWDELKAVIETLSKMEMEQLSPKEKAAQAESLLQSAAAKRNVVLKLRKKASKKIAGHCFFSY